MIDSVVLLIRLHHVRNRVDAVSPLLDGHSGEGLFQIQTTLTLCFNRYRPPACLRGLANPLASQNELIPPLSTTFVYCHYLPPFFVCFLPLPFGRPPIFA